MHTFPPLSLPIIQNSSIAICCLEFPDLIWYSSSVIPVIGLSIQWDILYLHCIKFLVDWYMVSWQKDVIIFMFMFTNSILKWVLYFILPPSSSSNLTVVPSRCVLQAWYAIVLRKKLFILSVPDFNEPWLYLTMLWNEEFLDAHAQKFQGQQWQLFYWCINIAGDEEITASPGTEAWWSIICINKQGASHETSTLRTWWWCCGLERDWRGHCNL